jgi:hypothetical protein
VKGLYKTPQIPQTPQVCFPRLAECRVGSDIDQDALNDDLRRILAEGGVSKVHFDRFERIMQTVFGDV